MRISIFGTGYVGLVTGACLAEVGNHVICVDIDANKLERLRRGETPIYEPGLAELLQRNIQAGRLEFTDDAIAAVDHARVVFIAVGTPSDEDGSADLGAVLDVAATIGRHLTHPVLVATKSTVPVGTARKVRQAIADNLARSVAFSVASNPEFLKEGAAVKDFMKPDRIIIGAEDAESEALLRQLYGPFNRNREKMISMDIPSAELTKYAANAMLATKISFMNELANIADGVGADIERVRIGIGSDPRIGYSFIYPGAGYGGSCFPKDIRALTRTARDHAVTPRLLDAVDAVNQRQKNYLFERIRQHFGDDLSGLTIALWGLAFKPDTDDMREAPSRVLLEALWNAGARVRAFDPKAMGEAGRLYGQRTDLDLCNDAYTALDGADALAVITEWKAFWSPDFQRMADLMRQPVVFDGRNIYEPAALSAAGFTHYAVGRPLRTQRQPANRDSEDPAADLEVVN